MGHVPLQLYTLYDELKYFNPRPSVSQQDLTKWDTDRFYAWVEALKYFKRPFSICHLQITIHSVLQSLDSKVCHYHKLKIEIKYLQIYRLTVSEERKRSLERVLLDLNYCVLVFNLMEGLIKYFEGESMEFTFNF